MSQRTTNARVLIVQPVIPKYRIPLFRALAQTPGWDLTILADTQVDDQLNQFVGDDFPFAVQHLPQAQLGPFYRRPNLRKLVKNIDPHAVILWGNPREITEMRALKWLKSRGVPVGVWSMFYRIGRRRWYSERMFCRMGQLADVLLSYGQRGFDEQLARGTPANKIVILQNAIDEQEIIRVRDSISDHEVAAFRKRQGLEGRSVILHLVRLTAIKRADLTLRAFALLVQKRPDAVLVFIGGGPLERRIKEDAVNLGLQANTRFVGPIYDEWQLGLWLKVSHMFVIATCVGLSIHHAMCYGLPVITDDSARTQTAEFEVLQDGVNGMTYPSGDLSTFAEKMNQLLLDEQLRSRMSRSAKHRIEGEYNLDNMVRNFRRAVAKLLVPARSLAH